MITIKVRKANFIGQIVGLLDRNTKEPLLLKTRFGIHTFGMKFPIDVIILNKSYKVMDLRQNLKPNRIFVWNPRYFIVLELPGGTIKKNHIWRNDVILVTFINS